MFKFASIFLLLFSFTSFADSLNSSQEEYLFLKTQLESLKTRKAKTLKNLESIRSGLEKEVFSLNAQVSSLESKQETLKSQLLVFDEDRLDLETADKKQSVILSQIKDFSFKNGFVEKTDSFKDLNAFLLTHLKKGVSFYTSTQKLYSLSGEKKESEIYSLGHIASYSKTKSGFKPLYYDKENQSFVELKNQVFLSEDAFTKAGAYQFGLVIQDSAPVVRSGFVGALKQKLKAGGAVGYVIILLGLIGVGVAVIRYQNIKTYSDFDEDSIAQVVAYVQNGDLDKAKAELYSQKSNPWNHFLDLVLSYRTRSDEIYEAKVFEEISRVQGHLSKYGPYLIVLAAVAPLLGLLGTVTGMIGTFEMITVHGTGNPKLLSGGIKEALVTTQMGLIVAIPCILIGNYLSSKASQLVSKFEELASILPKES